jgi:hypothetical protein
MRGPLPKEGGTIGHPKHAKGQEPIPRRSAKRLNANIVIPKASDNWHPVARSWYNSLALSGQAVFYEASDWATAVAAANALHKFMKTDNASILANFCRLSERLLVTEFDRKRARVDLTPQDVTDVDVDRATRSVVSWKGRLGVVQQNDEDDSA